MLLDHINSPADVKALDAAQLPQLCGELRRALVDTVSCTGGHLASNLGVVELTVAIHRVFDTANDRLVFDVGHQCYPHKLLTGRREQFSTLRQAGGLSGFPKPCESVHDAFVAGHASTAVSVALGMARARTLAGKDYHVLALLGDAAFGGGMNLEAMNDAGASGEHLIVILNDNGMSIGRSVGGLSGYLADLRTRPSYNAFKERYRRRLDASGAGKKLRRLGHSVKLALKESILPGSTMFEHMGFSYLGPVDGHDTEKLIQTLELAKGMAGPIVVHVHTVKGKGYEPAERDPGRFHGVSAFDAATGQPLHPAQTTYSDVFGETLCALAEEEPRLCAVTAAMRSGTGLDRFAAKYPDRFFDVGIAEEHAVAMAAGMAKAGAVPVFAVYSSFLQRGFDQLLHDVSLQRLHVVLAVDRAGLVGADGETHHGCFDPGYLALVPGMTVLCPADFRQMRVMLRRAVLECEGPVAVRFPRGGEQVNIESDDPWSILRPGQDGYILSYGPMLQSALSASELLAKKGISAGVIALTQIAPLADDALFALLRDARFLLVAEECMHAGGTGERLGAALARRGCVPEHYLTADLGGKVPGHGSVSLLRQQAGLDGPSLARQVEEALQ